MMPARSGAAPSIGYPLIRRKRCRPEIVRIACQRLLNKPPFHARLAGVCRRQTTLKHALAFAINHARWFERPGNKKGLLRCRPLMFCKWLRELDSTPRCVRGVCRRQTTLKHALACAINNALVRVPRPSETRKARTLAGLSVVSGSASWTRTNDPLINSQLLYQLSYRGTVGARSLVNPPR